MNLVILQGRLGKDPETKYGKSGNAYVNFSVATSEKRKDNDGNWVDETQWHRVTAFGKVAENVGQYLTKGSSVLIEGMIKYDQYQDKDGNPRNITNVIARRVTFLDTKRQEQPGAQQGRQQYQGQQSFQGGNQQRRPQGGGQGFQKFPQSGNQGFQGKGQSQGDFSGQGGFGDDDDIPF